MSKVGALLVAALCAVATVYYVREVKSLRRLRRSPELPGEERAYQHRQALRRLAGSLLLFVLSGMLAASHVAQALAAGRANDELASYEAAWRTSAIGRDLYKVRNVKPLWSRLGLTAGVAAGGLDMWTNELMGFSLFGTMKHGKSDAASTGLAKDYEPIVYPKPDGVLSFDKLSSVFLSNTNHDENQPAHLKLKDPGKAISVNYKLYASPETRYCPAGVYEILTDEGGANPRLQINAQNCVHCKTCDIKDPTQNINWVVPEGGGGPNYPNM